MAHGKYIKRSMKFEWPNIIVFILSSVSLYGSERKNPSFSRRAYALNRQFLSYFYMRSDSFVLFGGNTSHNLQINCLKSWMQLWSQEPSRTIDPQQMSFLHKRPRSRPSYYEGVFTVVAHRSHRPRWLPTTLSFSTRLMSSKFKQVATVHVYIHNVPTSFNVGRSLI